MVLIRDGNSKDKSSFKVLRCPECGSVIKTLGKKEAFLFRCIKNGHTFTGEQLGLKKREEE